MIGYHHHYYYYLLGKNSVFRNQKKKRVKCEKEKKKTSIQNKRILYEWILFIQGEHENRFDSLFFFPLLLLFSGFWILFIFSGKTSTTFLIAIIMMMMIIRRRITDWRSFYSSSLKVYSYNLRIILPNAKNQRITLFLCCCCLKRFCFASLNPLLLRQNVKVKQENDEKLLFKKKKEKNCIKRVKQGVFYILGFFATMFIQQEFFWMESVKEERLEKNHIFFPCLKKSFCVFCSSFESLFRKKKHFKVFESEKEEKTGANTKN